MEKTESAAAPWLVIPYGKGGRFQAFYNISEPNNTTSRKSIPELKRKSFYQKTCHQGWLIVFCTDDKFDYTPWKYGDCFLWNPSSKETMILPSLLKWYKNDRLWFLDCVLSSPPKSSTGGRNKDSTVVMLFGGEKIKGILLFCNPGDREWRDFLICRDTYYHIWDLESMCFFKGKLHVMTRYGEYLEIEIKIQRGSKPRDPSIREIETSNGILFEATGGVLGADHLKAYFLESSDGIFMINKVYIPRGIHREYCVTDMVIAKLDFSTESWVEVTSLDDHVFFLNGYTRLRCSAKELGLTRGCVYFTQPGEMTLYKYDLEDNSIMLSLPCPDLRKPWITANWLMIPKTLWIGEKRSVTKHLLGDGISLNNDDVKEDVEETIPWVLDDDMVWLVSNYLNPLDYIHFRAVSKIYRSIVPLANQKKSCSNKCLQTTNLSPWLVFSKDYGAVYNFINPMHNNESYLMSIPELLRGSRIRYSKGSWLFVSKGYYSVFFYNPFTKAIIKLPDLPDELYSSETIAFSSLPTSSDCVVFAISDDLDDDVRISFIRRGDEKWTEAVVTNVYSTPNITNIRFEPSLNSPVFHNGAFYCLDQYGILGVCTLENGIKWEVMSMVPLPDCDSIYASYLVEYEGKLLSVYLGQYGEWIRVFRLDLADMVWIEVKHLGQHMLFISNTSCIAAIAPTKQMENKIYFPRLKNEGILFYSLDSGKYHSLKSEYCGTDYCNSKEHLWCSWIEPNWSETTPPNFNWS